MLSLNPQAVKALIGHKMYMYLFIRANEADKPICKAVRLGVIVVGRNNQAKAIVVVCITIGFSGQGDGFNAVFKFLILAGTNQVDQQGVTHHDAAKFP